MPVQNVNEKVVNSSVAATTNFDYNLDNVGNGSQAFGLSLQVVYSGTFSYTIKLQASNDGTNFADISGTSVAVSSAGNTVYDLGFPNYKFLRLVCTKTSGTMVTTLNYRATNHS